MPSRRRLPAFLVVVAVAGILGYSLCGLAFGCGCTHVWAGAAEQCNVHNLAGPRCPWCQHPVLGGVGFGIGLALLLALYGLLERRRVPAPTALVVTLLAVAPAQVIAAGVTWLATDYPHWVADDVRSTWGIPSGPMGCHGPLPVVAPERAVP